jgi:hypothetical protein
VGVTGLLGMLRRFAGGGSAREKNACAGQEAGQHDDRHRDRLVLRGCHVRDPLCSG